MLDKLIKLFHWYCCMKQGFINPCMKINKNKSFLIWVSVNIVNYHIFCCNMFVFACSIIANSQCWLFALPSGQIRSKYPYLSSNIRICPHISVFAPEFNFRYLRNGLKEYMSMYNVKIDIVWYIFETRLEQSQLS